MRWSLLAAVLLVACVGCAEDKKAAEKGGGDLPEGRFSSDDPNATLHWLIREEREMRSRTQPANAASEKDAASRLDATVNAEVGKSIRWHLPIRQIESDGTVIFDGATWTPDKPDDTSPADRHYSLFVVDARQKTPEVPTASAFAPDAASTGWFKSAKGGDVAVIVGTVAGWGRQNTTYTQNEKQRRHWMYCVRLKDAHAEKP